VGDRLQEKGCVSLEEEQEMWPAWLTEGLEPTGIEALMAAAVSSEEEKVEPLDWDTLPEWLTEGLEETRWAVWEEEEVGQDLSHLYWHRGYLGLHSQIARSNHPRQIPA